MPANSGAIAGTVAHKHSAPSGDGGDLDEGITNFSGGSIGEVLTATATDTPVWASAGDTHNAGMLVAWAGTNANIPAGWLLCDGSSVATATYPDLFTALGYVYGGAGANFNLPSMVGSFIKGSATQTATTGGANSLTLSEAQMPDHTHVVTDPGHTHSWAGHIYYEDNNGNYFQPTNNSTYSKTVPSAVTGITIANTGGSTSFDNQPVFLELQYIIKT